MKQFIKYACIVIVLTISKNANSQEYRTNESIASQIKNNAVPNAKYSATPSSKRKADAAPIEQNLNKAIKEGRLAGMKPATTQAMSSSNTKANNGAGTSLPSEINAEDRRKEMNEAKKQMIATPTEQEEKKKE